MLCQGTISDEDVGALLSTPPTLSFFQGMFPPYGGSCHLENHRKSHLVIQSAAVSRAYGILSLRHWLMEKGSRRTSPASPKALWHPGISKRAAETRLKSSTTKQQFTEYMD